MVRPQYHIRDSAKGPLAWDVRRLIALSADLAPFELAVTAVRELDENHWYQHSLPTCRSVLEHAVLIETADLSYPVILDHTGRLMDGMHRICKAIMLKQQYVLAVQFPEIPAPDFIGVEPADLPYDD